MNLRFAASRVVWIVIILVATVYSPANVFAQTKWHVLYPGTNYCGLGDRGGDPVGGSDGVDAACKRHDEDWAQVERDNPGVSARQRKDLTADADRLLEQRLSSLQSNATTKSERTKAKRVLKLWRAYDRTRPDPFNMAGSYDISIVAPVDVPSDLFGGTVALTAKGGKASGRITFFDESAKFSAKWQVKDGQFVLTGQGGTFSARVSPGTTSFETGIEFFPSARRLLDEALDDLDSDARSEIEREFGSVDNLIRSIRVRWTKR